MSADGSTSAWRLKRRPNGGDNVGEFDDYDAPGAMLSRTYVPAGIWVTKDGSHVRIREMGDTHLLNCIAMLERNEKTFLPQYEKLLAERKRRGLDQPATTLRQIYGRKLA